MSAGLSPLGKNCYRKTARFATGLDANWAMARSHSYATPERMKSIAQVLLFHHVMGRTTGVDAFAKQLREAGHTVDVPDLFQGRTFSTIDSGLAYVREIGFSEITARGARVASEFPRDVVYAGFSLGVVVAQMLAQTREGARGALLFESCLPTTEFGVPWPADLPVQIHAMDADPYFVGEGDIDAARDLVATAHHAELFLYPGDQHLFADNSVPSYDARAAALLQKRVREFLRTLDGG